MFPYFLLSPLCVYIYILIVDALTFSQVPDFRSWIRCGSRKFWWVGRMNQDPFNFIAVNTRYIYAVNDTNFDLSIQQTKFILKFNIFNLHVCVFTTLLFYLVGANPPSPPLGSIPASYIKQGQHKISV